VWISPTEESTSFSCCSGFHFFVSFSDLQGSEELYILFHLVKEVGSGLLGCQWSVDVRFGEGHDYYRCLSKLILAAVSWSRTEEGHEFFFGRGGQDQMEGMTLLHVRGEEKKWSCMHATIYKSVTYAWRRGNRQSRGEVTALASFWSATGSSWNDDSNCGSGKINLHHPLMHIRQQRHFCGHHRAHLIELHPAIRETMSILQHISSSQPRW
jgi:hypothetical protein